MNAGSAPAGVSSFADKYFSKAVKPPHTAALPPPYLYKYVSVQKALHIILTQKIYFSGCEKFNDPFDGKVIFDQSTPENQRQLMERARQIQKINGSKEFAPDAEYGAHKDEIENLISEDHERLNIGVFCMSEVCKSFPMWAHYADEHAGCCLAFNFRGHRKTRDWKNFFPFVFTGKMKYPEDSHYPKFPGAEAAAPHQSGSIYTTKSPDWKYEKEWRAIAYDARVKPDSGLPENMRGAGEYELGKNMLEGVALGYKMNPSDMESVKAAAELQRLHVAQATPGKEEYTMNIKPL